MACAANERLIVMQGFGRKMMSGAVWCAAAAIGSKALSPGHAAALGQDLWVSATCLGPLGMQLWAYSWDEQRRETKTWEKWLFFALIAPQTFLYGAGLWATWFHMFNALGKISCS